jgi:hypothetical protein
LVVIWSVCACRGAAPAVLVNAVAYAPTCPAASAVFGPVQSQSESGTWALPLDGASPPPGRTWLLFEAAPPCEVRVTQVSSMCDVYQPCDDDHEAILAGRCDEPGADAPEASDATGGDTPPTADDAHPPMADDAHPPVVVSDDPPRCTLSRPVELQGDAIIPGDQPAAVQRALELERARPGRTLTLGITKAGSIPTIWEVSSIDFDAPTTEVGNSPENCPRSISVFVRTPHGIVQLDTPEGILGLLSDATGPAVVLTGQYGYPHNATFDVAHLPPHRPGATSSSTMSCIR